ncbi:type II secretion system ATPase GspE [Candidatus Babeliales bacterium]|nr:type II secretion system ATPase GspE [Candidatus Babeliales bacterium]
MLKKSIGQLLIDKGLLTDQVLKNAQSEASKARISFEQYIVESGLVKGEVLAALFAEQLNIPYFETISDNFADAETLSKVPLKFLREHGVMPLKEKGKLSIATADPTDFQPLDELMLLYGGNLPLVVSTRKIIIDALNHYYPLETSEDMIDDLEEENEMGELSFGDIDEKDILNAANDAPIIKLVNYILFQADKRGASDIHISPQEKEIRVRYRIDGVMKTVMTPPKRIQGALASRIKIMSNLNIAEKRLPQDGRIEIKISDKSIDIRVSVLPVKFGESIVMRLLDKGRGFTDLEKMGFGERDMKAINDIVGNPNGIILVTGPTGSGKTTTLYSILDRLNTSDVNIITVEDPVEYQLAGISQVQVHEKVGLTFAASLRSILRQDPDIVMIGETRDAETAQIAIQAALTGHLVLSTLHTNSAPASITRLIDMGVEPFLISSSVIGVIAQRLVRRLCNECKESYHPTQELLTTLGIKAKASTITFYKAKGCAECEDLGYRGRLPLFEVMKMTEDISRLTMERSSTTVMRQQAHKDGMQLLVTDGINKVQQGLTSIDEVLSVATVYDEAA